MNSTNFLSKVRSLLHEQALLHTPEGSDVQAVTDQWAHALATASSFFCNPEVAAPELIRQEVIDVLTRKELYKGRDNFFAKIFGELKLKPNKNSSFTFIDLFAGIGGLRLGFQQAGGACVFSSEFDKHAQATYENNHGEYPFGDITMINPSHIPDHDVLLAGFPCQPFSHAGLKGGIADTRGTLFYNIAQILETKRPKFALLENVRGLISHDKGYTLKVILNSLIDIGYSCNIPKETIRNGTTKEVQELAKKMVLKSVDFGVPQNRQRIYIVLWQDGLIDKFEYPEPLNVKTRVGDILEKNPDPKLTISDRLWEGHQRRKAQNRRDGKGFGYGIVNVDSPYTNTISARYYKDGSEVLVYQENNNPRKLSPREAARLQGFPEEFEPSASNTQAYKQFGNSVTVDVIEAIAKKIAQLQGVSDAS